MACKFDVGVGISWTVSEDSHDVSAYKERSNVSRVHSVQERGKSRNAFKQERVSFGFIGELHTGS